MSHYLWVRSCTPVSINHTFRSLTRHSVTSFIVYCFRQIIWNTSSHLIHISSGSFPSLGGCHIRTGSSEIPVHPHQAVKSQGLPQILRIIIMFDPIVPAGNNCNNLYITVSDRNGECILVIGQEAERLRHGLTTFIFLNDPVISHNRNTNFIRIRSISTVRSRRSYIYFKSLRSRG